MNSRHGSVHVAVACLIGTMFSSGAFAADAQPSPGMPRDDAVARGSQVLMAPVGERTITIDGDLEDWGDLRGGEPWWDRPFLLHHHMNHSTGALPDRPSAALVRVLYDADAIYLAVRVADESVTNPFEGIDIYRGDGFELFLDVRPVATDDVDVPTMGTREFTAGVHQLLIAAPTTTDGPVRTHAVDRGAPPIGEFEVAGQQIDGGWQVEMRVPWASLMADIPADRFNEPIGFEVMINDLDEHEGRPGAQRAYSLSRKRGYTRNASLFGVALPVGPEHEPDAELHAPYWLDGPYRYLWPTAVGEHAGRSGALAAVATNLENAPEHAALSIEPTFEVTALEPAGAGDRYRPAFDDPEIRWREDYPVLGVSVFRTLLPNDAWHTGRYEFMPVLDAARGAPAPVEAYGPLLVGNLAPPFEVETVDGETVHIEDFRGQYVLVELWRTTCGICRATKPVLNQVHEQFSDNGRFELLALSAESSLAETREYIEQHNLRGVQAHLGARADANMVRHYTIERGVPRIMLFDPDGRLLARDLHRSAIYETVAGAMRE